MKIRPSYKMVPLTLIIGLAACSQQNWYQGAKSAQTANCMKEPLAEYADCNQASDESYDEYSKKRKELELVEENKVK